MTRPSDFHPEVEADLDGIAGYYDSQSPGLGDQFLARVRERFITIGDHPLQFGRYWRNWRIALVTRFPYKIVFRIAGSVVFVVAVIHVRRHDRVWKARI